MCFGLVEVRELPSPAQRAVRGRLEEGEAAVGYAVGDGAQLGGGQVELARLALGLVDREVRPKELGRDRCRPAAREGLILLAHHVLAEKGADEKRGAHAEKLDRREHREGWRQRVAHSAIGKIELTSSLGIELADRALAEVVAALSAHGVELLGAGGRGSEGGAIEAVGEKLEHQKQKRERRERKRRARKRRERKRRGRKKEKGGKEKGEKGGRSKTKTSALKLVGQLIAVEGLDPSTSGLWAQHAIHCATPLVYIILIMGKYHLYKHE